MWKKNARGDAFLKRRIGHEMIITENLILRFYTLKDAEFLHKLMNSEAWLRNIGDRGIKTVENAEDYITINYFSAYEKYRYGPYLVSLKESGVPIGSVGLYKRETLEHPDIGFAFLPEFWNRGFALEAADAVMKFSITGLNIKTILGITLPDNLSSIKLLKKLGLLEIGDYTTNDGEDLLLFSN